MRSLGARHTERQWCLSLRSGVTCHAQCPPQLERGKRVPLGSRTLDTLRMHGLSISRDLTARRQTCSQGWRYVLRSAAAPPKKRRRPPAHCIRVPLTARHRVCSSGAIHLKIWVAERRQPRRRKTLSLPANLPFQHLQQPQQRPHQQPQRPHPWSQPLPGRHHRRRLPRRARWRTWTTYQRLHLQPANWPPSRPPAKN